MAEEENPIRWTRNLSAAAWIGARLDRSSGRDRVTAVVPAGSRPTPDLRGRVPDL
jgi:hypothetical protein